MTQERLADRRSRFAAVLKSQGVAAYFASTPATMGYFNGLSEGGGERLLTMAYSPSGDCRFIAPALSANQARRLGVEDIRDWRDGENPLLHVRELGADWDLAARTIAIDDDAPAFLALALQESIPGAKVVTGHDLRTEVMAIKEDWELELMGKAGAIADRAYDEVLGKLRPGMTEKEVQSLLFESMASQGGLPAFGIIAAGPAGAEPHHETSEDCLEANQVVVMDFGCTYEGYYSDITRTIAFGDPGDEARRVYATVYAAHMAARETIRPGTAYQMVDRAARKVIEEAGYGPEFCHRTGHGIGMNIHEAPNVVEGETRPLQPGACFSIEPGIYLETRFGVRIENIVCVTSNGHHSFNQDPPAELVCL